MEVEGRLQHLGRVAGQSQHRRQGQRRRRRQRRADQGLDRLRRIRLHQAKHLTYTKMVNKDGKTVAPTSATFQAAAANANWSSVPGYGVILANQPGAESWPMSAATWILLYKKPQDAAATAEALKFFAWAYD